MRNLLRLTGFVPHIVVVFLSVLVDLGHKIIVQNTAFKIYDGQIQIVLTAIVYALILLPAVLLLTPVGFLADNYSKNCVMRTSAWAAVGLMWLITFCCFAGSFWPAFGMMFFLAVQSAIYSPAKYGYIKELVGKQHLPATNDMVRALPWHWPATWGSQVSIRCRIQR